MAGIAAALRAVATAEWRALQSLQSIAGNNFFLFVALLMQDPKSGAFFLVLIGALVLFPLSADPLRLLPRDRLVLWPFSSRQVGELRAASMALSPVVWILVVLILRTARLRPALGWMVVAACVQVAMQLARQWSRRLPQWNPLRLVPAFPGALGGFVRKDIRQMLWTLDFYLACLLGSVGVAYRVFSAKPDPAAIPVLTLLVVLALSTWAQCLFGMDGEAGVMRYCLLPLRSWRILLLKDTAWLLVLTPLVVGLSPLTGFTAGFVTLAVGHHASVRRPAPQKRWRFTSGMLLPVGLVQVVAMFAAGTAVERIGLWYLTGSMICWVVSLAVYGFWWDRGRA